MANSYLTRTISSNGSKRTFTFSAWVKRSEITSYNPLFGHISDSGNDYFAIGFNNSDQLFAESIASGNNQIVVKPNRLFRDTNAWYHIVVAVDTTQATASNRVKIYINGVQETSFATSTYPSQNADIDVNVSGEPMVVGGMYDPVNTYFDGYISHAAFVDGQALAQTVFGETDSTSGIWKFKSPSGVTWGTNGFHLKFENSGALGADSSGQGNTFTVQGNLKQALDTPSNNHATLNSLDTGYSSAVINLANGNNTTMNTSGFGDYGIRSTLGVSKGKWYWECKNAAVNGGGGNTMAIIPMSKRLVINIMSASGPTAGVYGIQRYSDSSINIHTNGSVASQNTAMWGGITTSDVIGFALDMDNGKLYLSKNGDFKDSSGNTGNPATQANPTFTGISTGEFHGFYSELRMNNDNGLQVNFGNGFFGTTAITSAGSNGNGSLFEYDVPSGFYALNTKNLNTYG